MAKLTGHPHLGNSVTNKLTIQSVDPPGDPITANFNPKELQITKKVPWEKQKNSKGDMPNLEFTAAEAETMSVELFFDTYESKKDVYETYIVGLRALCLIPEGAKGEKKRPPLVVVAW